MFIRSALRADVEQTAPPLRGTPPDLGWDSPHFNTLPKINTPSETWVRDFVAFVQEHALVPLCTASIWISSHTREMKNLLQFGLMSTLLLGTFGCAAENSEKAAADARVNSAQEPATRANLPAKARLVIPSGTLLKVSLSDALSTDGNSPGDHFMASLAESVVVDGTTVLQKGTQLRGRVVAVEGSGRVKGRASIQLALTDIMQGDSIVAITTNRFSATAAASKTRDGEIIAGGAGLGAVIGAIAGGGKGAGIGALAGGGAGTGVVLATKGKEIHYGPETRLDFTLTNSVQM